MYSDTKRWMFMLACVICEDININMVIVFLNKLFSQKKKTLDFIISLLKSSRRIEVVEDGWMEQLWWRPSWLIKAF